jgi:hypothetical protein
MRRSLFFSPGRGFSLSANVSFFLFLMLIVIPFILSQSALASQVKLAWDPNSESDLAGYRLYYGTASRTYGPSIDLGNVTKFTLAGLSPGQTYYFALTAYDLSNNESGFSAEVSGVASEHFSNLIAKYYNDILDRTPEPGGAEYWAGEVERIGSDEIDFKEGFVTVGEIFFNSQEYYEEFKSDADFITDLYQAFLNRSPDPAGMSYWLSYLAQGSRGMALIYFVRSAEFQAYIQDRIGSGIFWPENDLINDLYRGFFTRLPDPGGFNSWLTLMRNAQCQGAQQVRNVTSQIALAFMWSQEYVSANRDNGGFVEDLYNGILRRGAASSEVAYWANLLSTHTYDRDDVLQSFINSQEFQARVQQVIDAGCAQ